MTPGQTLRVTVPILASGSYTGASSTVTEQGGVFTVTAVQVQGFSVTRYAVKASSHGRVRLVFQSTTLTLDGKSRLEKKSTGLPFVLPAKSEYIRLVYFVRSSRADHNMAIAASPKLEDLEGLTAQLKISATACTNEGALTCVWVPQGIGVRSE